MMAIFSSGMARSWRRQQAPVTRLAGPRERHAPLWPTFSIVFLLCLPSIFLPLAVTVLNAILVALAIGVVLLTNRRIDQRLLVIIAITIGIACCGFLTGHDADRYEYFKDAWYLFNPVLILLTGYTLYAMKPDLGRGLRAFVVAGIIVAIWQLRGYMIDPSIIQLSVSQIRRIIGTGSYVPVVALVILIICFGKWRSLLKFPAWIAALAAVIAGLAVAGVFSRSALVVVGIGFAALIGCFQQREWLRVGLPAAVLIFLGYLAQFYFDTESTFALDTYFGKLLRTLQELTAGDGASIRDININFRAFETERALEQFGQGSILSMLFGQGFGATVDLGITMPLQISDTGFVGVREIGSFHNGYIFLLVKTGFVGLALYVALLVYLYRTGRAHVGNTENDSKLIAAKLLQFSAVTLAATTFFIGGWFNRSDMVPVLLMTGFVLAHLSRPTEAELGPTLVEK